MNARRNMTPRFNRSSLATEAMQAAISVRGKAKFDQHRPICVYELCERIGLVVRFNDINMEGMYQRGVPPRIHLSARRPLVRRAYNCAHELGHHVFGHGSSIDELREEAKEHPWEDPKEFLADTFAGFVLMPTIGLRSAFRVRGCTPENVTPDELFCIASDFGVGYATLITHLTYGLNMIARSRATVLQRAKPNTIRARTLGALTQERLIVMDRHSVATTVDAEVTNLLLLPSRTETDGNGLAFERDLVGGRLFRAVRPGIVRANADAGAWATFVRVAPKEYVGLAKYRHLEVDEDE